MVSVAINPSAKLYLCQVLLLAFPTKMFHCIIHKYTILTTRVSSTDIIHRYHIILYFKKAYTEMFDI